MLITSCSVTKKLNVEEKLITKQTYELNGKKLKQDPITILSKTSVNKKILGFKRVSLDNKQIIICITNMSSKSQKVLLGNKENKYKNLLRNNISIIDKRLILKPFETVWLSN